MGFQQFVHRHKVDLCLALIIIGGFLITVCALGYLYKEDDVGFSADINEFLGAWINWLAVLGSVLLLFGAYYFIDFIVKLREFKKLIAIPGKSKFIQNQDRVEELAWRLHPKYENIVVKKKKELRVR